ncbi:MAG: ribokinase [Burkholderiales bacterium]|nr:ribokinase [Opitutaceae bacterium]
MPAPLLNFGSLNIDRVYGVPHFVRPGETLAAHSFTCHAGGKGLNQSIALARAGARVTHAGAIGPDGGFLRELLDATGVDTAALLELQEPTGHAVIQINDAGQNAIVLHGGANHALTTDWVDATLARFPADGIVLTQNETNLTAHILESAHARGCRLAWNPAPITEACRAIPLAALDYLVLNEVEGAALSGQSKPESILAALSARAPRATIVLTLGAQGAVARVEKHTLTVPAERVARVVDTTAAGDTYIGYLLASLATGQPLAQAMNTATHASAWCVRHVGAAPSIPTLAQLSAPAAPDTP